MIVDEGDNHPLAMGAPHLELPLYRLRFFYPANGKLTLLYGNEVLPSPRYDLELLAPRLVGISSLELALDPDKLCAGFSGKHCFCESVLGSTGCGCVGSSCSAGPVATIGKSYGALRMNPGT